MGSSSSTPNTGAGPQPATLDDDPTLAAAGLDVAVFTIFPQLVDAFAAESLLGRAQRRGLIRVGTHDLRDFTDDVHRSVDDAPFGGGAGMVMTPEPIFAAVEATAPPRPLLTFGHARR